MIEAVLLDTGPLGLITNPRRSPDAEACRAWLADLVAADIQVFIPEIVDYELRRELTRTRKMTGLARLNRMAEEYQYLPVTTEAWRQAALFWAQARQQGQPTAGNRELDGDVILAAQAITLPLPADQVVVATGNAGHLGRFVTAKAWLDIP